MATPITCFSQLINKINESSKYVEGMYLKTFSIKEEEITYILHHDLKDEE